MVVFPNAKINLGLEILRKREDGYHDIDSVFMPIHLRDILEVVPNDSDKDEWHLSGLPIPGRLSDNLCLKLVKRIRDDYQIPHITCFLHKAIPMGAGLGGGSADVSFLLKALDEQFDLALTDDYMKEVTLALGSDCPFFLENRPMRAQSRGELLTPVDLDLSGHYLLLVSPGIHISTADAYGKATPEVVEISPSEIVKRPVNEWKSSLRNRFEDYALNAFPVLAELKEELYRKGAVYASMSGSGSAFYGIFSSPVDQAEFSRFGEVHVVEL